MRFENKRPFCLLRWLDGGDHDRGWHTPISVNVNKRVRWKELNGDKIKDSQDKLWSGRRMGILNPREESG